MRDARRFSAREVSQGVQRHVLGQTTWFGSTVTAHSGAVPPVFQRLTARSRPADRGRGRSRAAATTVTAPAAKAPVGTHPPAWRQRVPSRTVVDGSGRRTPGRDGRPYRGPDHHRDGSAVLTVVPGDDPAHRPSRLKRRWSRSAPASATPRLLRPVRRTGPGDRVRSRPAGRWRGSRRRPGAARAAVGGHGAGRGCRAGPGSPRRGRGGDARDQVARASAASTSPSRVRARWSTSPTAPRHGPRSPDPPRGRGPCRGWRRRRRAGPSEEPTQARRATAGTAEACRRIPRLRVVQALYAADRWKQLSWARVGGRWPGNGPSLGRPRRVLPVTCGRNRYPHGLPAACATSGSSRAGHAGGLVVPRDCAARGILRPCSSDGLPWRWSPLRAHSRCRL